MATLNSTTNNNNDIPKTMRAWQFSSTRGGIENNLHLNASTPVPAHDARALGRDKVLIKTLAASINPVDYKLAELPAVGRLLFGKDTTPGSDFAGVVVAAAAEAASSAPGGTSPDEFKKGDLVFGMLKQPTKHGTFAEYLVVERAKLTRLPEGVDPVDAAGVGIAGLTAYQCIRPFVQPGTGQRVFINGGSGGTGVWGIQIAKALGCHVTTCCSGANAELCRNLGADEVIDYRTTNVVDALKKSVSGPGARTFDLVVDNIGTSPDLYWQCHHYLREGARYVQIGAEPGAASIVSLIMKLTWPGFLGGGKRKLDMLMMKHNSEHMADMANLMRQKKIKTVLHDGTALSFEDGAKAFAILKTHRAKGKIVVKMSGE